MRVLRHRRVLGGLLATAILLPGALLATDTPSEPPTHEPLVIMSEEGDHWFRVEIARTIAERGQGLMERDQLDEDAGMLFLYRHPQTPRHGFWMYRTRIPLDIAFLDEAGRILTIHRMEPCESDDHEQCPVTYPGTAYHAALEVNAGTFEALGIAAGDCVSWPGSGSRCGRFGNDPTGARLRAPVVEAEGD